MNTPWSTRAHLPRSRDHAAAVDHRRQAEVGRVLGDQQLGGELGRPVERPRARRAGSASEIPAAEAPASSWLVARARSGSPVASRRRARRAPGTGRPGWSRGRRPGPGRGARARGSCRRRRGWSRTDRRCRRSSRPAPRARPSTRPARRSARSPRAQPRSRTSARDEPHPGGLEPRQVELRAGAGGGCRARSAPSRDGAGERDADVRADEPGAAGDEHAPHDR